MSYCESSVFPSILGRFYRKHHSCWVFSVPSDAWKRICGFLSHNKTSKKKPRKKPKRSITIESSTIYEVARDLISIITHNDQKHTKIGDIIGGAGGGGGPGAVVGEADSKRRRRRRGRKRGGGGGQGGNGGSVNVHT